MAIYNAHTLNFAFAGVVYKELLGHKLGLEDLREVDPHVYNSLKQLLAYPADRVEADMGLTFQVTHELDFCIEQHNLVADGGSILVTGSNRQEFVDAYVHFLLVERVAAQAGAFCAGFRRVCDSPVLQMFEGPELEQVVCGCVPPFGLRGLCTSSNRSVDAYVHFVPVERVTAQAEASCAGFRRVCDLSGLAMFEGPELEQVVCGCGATFSMHVVCAPRGKLLV